MSDFNNAACDDSCILKLPSKLNEIYEALRAFHEKNNIVLDIITYQIHEFLNNDDAEIDEKYFEFLQKGLFNIKKANHVINVQSILFNNNNDMQNFFEIISRRYASILPEDEMSGDIYLDSELFQNASDTASWVHQTLRELGIEYDFSETYQYNDYNTILNICQIYILTGELIETLEHMFSRNHPSLLMYSQMLSVAEPRVN